MYKMEKHTPLLYHLTEQMIDAVERDEELKAKGYQIYYVLDTYDVFEYCFPFGKEFEKAIDVQSYSDQQIVYDHIIRRRGDIKPVILDQYKIELFGIKDRIRRTASMFDMSRAKLNVLIDFLTSTEKPDTTTAEEIKNATTLFIAENLTVLLSVALGLERNEIKRFVDLLENRLQIENFGSSDSADDLLVREVFASTGKSHFTDIIFDEFVEKYQKQYSTLTPTDLFVEFRNIYRDCIVVDRLIHLNSRMIELTESGKLSKGYIFLYLSSTPKRSNQIFDLPSVKNRKVFSDNNAARDYPFHRSVSQEFARLIFLEKGDDSASGGAKHLRTLVQSMRGAKFGQRDRDSRQDAASESDLLREFELAIDFQRNRVENFELFRQLDSYRAELQAAVRYFENGGGEDKLLRCYLKLQSLASVEYDFKSRRAEVEAALSNIRIESLSLRYNLHSRVQSFRHQETRITISKGADAVRGTYHHLPLLLFYDFGLQEKQRPLLDRLIDYCAMPERLRSLNENTISKRRDFLETLAFFGRSYQEISYFLPAIQGTLLHLFAYVLLPTTSDKDLKIAQTDSAKIVEICERSIAVLKQIEVVKNPGIGASDEIVVFAEIGSTNNIVKYRREFLYFGIWIARRCCQYRKSLKMAEEGILLFPEDGRFYHGKFLTIFAQECEKSLKKQQPVSPIIYRECIDLAKIALKLYQVVLEKFGSSSSTVTTFGLEVLRRSMVSVQNSIAYFLAELFWVESGGHELSKFSSRLIESRLYLEKVRGFDGTHWYESFPEFLHTEATLELNEARLLRSEGKLALAHSKIGEARKRIIQAIGCLPAAPELYVVLAKDIEDFPKDY